MIEVWLWELVRDWVHKRFKHIKITKFQDTKSGDPLTVVGPINHIGRITVKFPKREAEEIGFVATKGVIIWPPEDPTNSGHNYRSMNYIILKATDPKMFEKIEKILRKYEPKRSK